MGAATAAAGATGAGGTIGGPGASGVAGAKGAVEMAGGVGGLGTGAVGTGQPAPLEFSPVSPAARRCSNSSRHSSGTDRGSSRNWLKSSSINQEFGPDGSAPLFAFTSSKPSRLRCDASTSFQPFTRSSWA